MYRYWFAAIRPLSQGKKRALCECVSSVEELYRWKVSDYRACPFLKEREVQTILQSKREWQLEENYQELCRQGIRLVTWAEKDYPSRLRTICDPPYGLYFKGTLPQDETLSVAMVGARQCSEYGRKQSGLYSRILAEHGVQIISGLARGIDGISQESACRAGGSTYAVVGCGVDICYPREHIDLYMSIQEKGGILSEYPPGYPPLPQNFPSRNRIISGLSDLVLIMEAKQRSGSLITADMALEQGRDVYALPGPVDSALSQGCHQLIRQGAGILTSPEELLEEMKMTVGNQFKNLEKKENVLDNTENMVYSNINLFPQNITGLAEQTGMHIPELMNILISLELKGYIREVSKNYFVRQ